VKRELRIDVTEDHSVAKDWNDFGSDRKPMTFDLAHRLRCEWDQLQSKKAALNNSDGCMPPQL